MTPDELDAIEAEIVEGDESVDDLADLIAALREAWAEVERLRRGEVDGIFTSVVHECCEQVARVRAICTRADNDEFHSPYQVAEFIRDAIEARAEACPFCTREARAECESTGGRCSEEDEIDAVLNDRPDLNTHEALIAGLREAWAEAERTLEYVRNADQRVIEADQRTDEARADRDEACAEAERLRDEVGAADITTAVYEADADEARAEATRLADELDNLESLVGDAYMEAVESITLWRKAERALRQTPTIMGITRAEVCDLKAEVVRLRAQSEADLDHAASFAGAIARVRALHNPRPTGPKPEYLDRCDWCRDPYPCATIRALDGEAS